MLHTVSVFRQTTKQSITLTYSKVYVSLAAHIAIIHGNFRFYRDEASTRNMWTLYILDRWLSVLMGRPPVLADEAITLPRPRDFPGMPSPVGLRAHIELSEISGYIVCDAYKIAPRYQTSSQDNRGTAYHMDQALRLLDEWIVKLPEELQISDPTQARGPACLMLHMRYNQLVVLTTRPLFFAAVKRAVAKQTVDARSRAAADDEQRHIDRCTAAARANMRLAEQVRSSKSKLLQAGLHLTFNAAVILLLRNIMVTAQHKNQSDDPLIASDSSDIRFAITVFDEERRTGTNYQRDCCEVLEDLKALSHLYHEHRKPKSPTENANQSFTTEETLSKIVLPWAQDEGLEIDHSLGI